jgi:23S rRNA (cytosine1962-C5)-methyltransferase
VNSKSGQDFKKYLTKSGWEQLLKGHPWLLKKHLSPEFTPPQNHSLAHLGEHWFSVSPKSPIPLRRVGPSMRNWAFGEKDKNYPMKFLGPSATGPEVSLFWTSIKNHFVETLKYKKSLNPNDTCFRWIFSENDLFPGLIVDIFGHTAIAQIQTPFVEDFWDTIFLVLCESLRECHFNLSKFQWSILRNHQFRNDEGLELIENENLSLEESVETWMGLKWKMSPGRGQKTGAFLDQGDNHLRAVHWSKQLSLKTCWDLFCFEGGFGVHLLHETQAQVTFVDSSEKALLACEANLTLNNLDPNRAKTIKQDVFAFLRQDHETQPDLIVLDPPSLAKKQSHRTSALNSFRDLNLQAAKKIKSGGMIISCSCSQVISKDDYMDMLRSAAHSARRSFSVLEVNGPSADHAPLVGFPEGDYLQAWYLRVV